MNPWGLAFTCIIALLGACGDDPPADGTYDFSASAVDLSIVPSTGDAGAANADLAGYDVTCDPAAPLGGGDPTGAWSYAAACADADAFFQLQASCAGIQITDVSVSAPSGNGGPYGSLTLYAGQTYVRNVHARMQARATVPTSCTQPFGGCAAYASGQAAQFNWLDITCQPIGGTCTCAVSADVSRAETGAWSADATGYTLNAAVGGPQHFDATATATTLRQRGDASTLRGNRGITYVLVR